MTKEDVKNKVCMWLAFRMPKRLVYWCSIRLEAYATTGKYRKTVVTNLKCIEAGNRFYNDFLSIKTKKDETKN
jgi:hypothetical protein